MTKSFKKQVKQVGNETMKSGVDKFFGVDSGPINEDKADGPVKIAAKSTMIGTGISVANKGLGDVVSNAKAKMSGVEINVTKNNDGNNKKRRMAKEPDVIDDQSQPQLE